MKRTRARTDGKAHDLGQTVGSRIRRIWPGGDPALSQTLCRVVKSRHPLGVVSEREPSLPSDADVHSEILHIIAFSGAKCA
jgi:hypothetical protein